MDVAEQTSQAESNMELRMSENPLRPPRISQLLKAELELMVSLAAVQEEIRKLGYAAQEVDDRSLAHLLAGPGAETGETLN